MRWHELRLKAFRGGLQNAALISLRWRVTGTESSKDVLDGCQACWRLHVYNSLVLGIFVAE